MSQGLRYARMCAKGWVSYHQAMMAGIGNCPWKRWAEWRDINYINPFSSSNPYSFAVYLLDGKRYDEQTRERKVRNADGTPVTIKERRLVRVK